MIIHILALNAFEIYIQEFYDPSFLFCDLYVRHNFPFQVSSWWGAFCGVVAHWLLGEDEQAEALYSTLENVPEVLKASDDPLPMAVLYAVR